MSELKAVNMKVRPETVENVEAVQELIKASNKTQAVVAAISLAKTILEAVKEGKKVQFADTNGDVETLKLIGY